jgi:hypothetical protein
LGDADLGFANNLIDIGANAIAGIPNTDPAQGHVFARRTVRTAPSKDCVSKTDTASSINLRVGQGSGTG